MAELELKPSHTLLQNPCFMQLLCSGPPKHLALGTTLAVQSVNPLFSLVGWPQLLSLCTLMWTLKGEELAQDILFPQRDEMACSVSVSLLHIRHVVHAHEHQEKKQESTSCLSGLGSRHQPVVLLGPTNLFPFSCIYLNLWGLLAALSFPRELQEPEGAVGPELRGRTRKGEPGTGSPAGEHPGSFTSVTRTRVPGAV